MAKKTLCPITRAAFRAKGKPIAITINGVPMEAKNREFSTGSLGWYLNNKMTIDVDGTPVAVQIGLNVTIVGSKELPPDPTAPAVAAPAATEQAP